jgi:hypothetical protein
MAPSKAVLAGTVDSDAHADGETPAENGAAPAQADSVAVDGADAAASDPLAEDGAPGDDDAPAEVAE